VNDVFMGVWNGSQTYGRVIVASKVPLPNYRPDLDDKRPQREVCLCNSVARSYVLLALQIASAYGVFVIICNGNGALILVEKGCL
jgi:hypothetical protein